MPRLNSFYLAPELWREPYVLEGAEAHHLIKVLRTEQGETVRLFDGCGREGLFVVQDMGKRTARLGLISIDEREKPASQLYLALGFGKQARRDMVLEKTVELGGAGLIFWQAERSQGKMIPEPKPAWRDKTIQAAKQCGSPFLPELFTVPGGATGLIDFSKDFEHRILLWESATDAAFLSAEMLTRPGKTLAVIGPEGGLTREEAHLFKEADFSIIHLGAGILRWETAALLCLGAAYLEKQSS